MFEQHFMNSRSQVLLDFGGTHTKSQTWTDGVLVNQEVCKSPQLRRGSRGEATINPKEFSSHVLRVFGSAMRSASPFCELAVSSQMACFVLVNADGIPSGEIVSWQDERCSEPDEHGVTTLQRVAIQLEQDGHALWDGLRPGLPLCYLSELLKHEKSRDSFYLMSLAQFAILSLFPAIKPGQLRIHSSEAAATGLFDPISSCWSTSLISLLGLENLIFPEVTNNFQVIDEEFKVYVPIGDFQAAIAGSSVETNELFIHIATGGQVARPVPRSTFKIEEQPGDDSPQVRPSADANQLIVTRTHLPAGRLLTSLSGLLSLSNEQQFWGFVDSALLRPCSVSAKFESENNFELSLDNLSPRGIEPEEIVTSIVQALHAIYIAKARQLGLSGVSRLVFSGGALTKLPIFMSQFEDHLGLKSTRRTIGEDTSLKGLANLINASLH